MSCGGGIVRTSTRIQYSGGREVYHCNSVSRSPYQYHTRPCPTIRISISFPSGFLKKPAAYCIVLDSLHHIFRAFSLALLSILPNASLRFIPRFSLANGGRWGWGWRGWFLGMIYQSRPNCANCEVSSKRGLGSCRNTSTHVDMTHGADGRVGYIYPPSGSAFAPILFLILDLRSDSF